MSLVFQNKSSVASTAFNSNENRKLSVLYRFIDLIEILEIEFKRQFSTIIAKSVVYDWITLMVFHL